MALEAIANLKDLVLPISEDFEKLTDAWTEEFIRWGNPALVGKHRATEGWAMTNLAHVLYVAGAYTVFVLFGLALKASSNGESKTEPGFGFVKAFAALYNLGQVVLCAYMIYGAVVEAMRGDYLLVCNPFVIEATGMARILHIFYLSKIYDFVDTFLIVIRGKWRQLSFLHVYHHLSIFLVYWGNTVAGYDGDIYYTVVLNSFVHLVMYSYYLVTLFNVPVPRPIKQAITRLQMAQFITMNLQAGYILYHECAFPRNITWLYLFYIVSLFILFSNFSARTYSAPAAGAGAGAGAPRKGARKSKKH